MVYPLLVVERSESSICCYLVMLCYSVVSHSRVLAGAREERKTTCKTVHYSRRARSKRVEQQGYRGRHACVRDTTRNGYEGRRWPVIAGRDDRAGPLTSPAPRSGLPARPARDTTSDQLLNERARAGPRDRLWGRKGKRGGLTALRTDFLLDSCISPAMMSSSSICGTHTTLVRLLGLSVLDGTHRVGLLIVEDAVGGENCISWAAGVERIPVSHRSSSQTLPKYRSRTSTYLQARTRRSAGRARRRACAAAAHRWMSSRVMSSLSCGPMPQTKKRLA